MPGSIKFCNGAESQEGRANSFFTERLGGGISLSAGFPSDGCRGGDSERENEEAAPQKMKQTIGRTRKQNKNLIWLN